MARPVISLQLYTVRDHAARDMPATLRRVAELGYEGVELAGYGSASQSELLRALDETGLHITGAHVGLDKLQDDMNAVVEEQAALKNTNVIVPFLDASHRDSLEKWQQTARIFDDVGRRLREHGLTLHYHNHDFEFQRFDNGGGTGTYGLDVLYDNTDPLNLQAELDCYWVQKGGVDPAAYIKKLAGRVSLLHIKDMAANGDFAEIGQGTLNWPEIFAAAEAQGVTTYIVEQDSTPGDAFDSVRISLDNLKTMGKLASS